jgi:hypothetical protein
MNIFAMHRDPVVAARLMSDQHCGKELIECAQMLCYAMYARNLTRPAPYKDHDGLAHGRHRCSIWVGRSMENMQWTIDHAKALYEEHNRRYGTDHQAIRTVMFAEIAIRSKWFDLPPVMGFLDPFEDAFDRDYLPHAKFWPEYQSDPWTSVAHQYRRYYAWKRQIWQMKTLSGEFRRPMTMTWAHQHCKSFDEAWEGTGVVEDPRDAADFPWPITKVMMREYLDNQKQEERDARRKAEAKKAKAGRAHGNA